MMANKTSTHASSPKKKDEDDCKHANDAYPSDHHLCIPACRWRNIIAAMRVVPLLSVFSCLLCFCSSFLSYSRIAYSGARFARKFDEADFIEIKVPRPLGLDLEEVDDGVFKGVYIAGFTKDGNADKALRKEFLTPTNLFIVKANQVDLRSSNFDEVMDAITSTDGEVSLTLIDPNAVIKGTAILDVTDKEGNRRLIKCLKGQRLRTVLNDNNVEVQDPKGSNCGGGVCINQPPLSVREDTWDYF